MSILGRAWQRGLLAVLLIAAAATTDAAAAPGAALAGLRAAVVALIDSIGTPATKADKKTLSQLEKALALIDGNPVTLADEIGAALKATSSLPPSVLTTPGVNAAIDAALATYLTDVDAALDAVDAAVAALGVPDGIPAVAKSLAAARTSLAAAQNPAATDLARIAALKAAMKKHGAATKALEKFLNAGGGPCGNPKIPSPTPPGSATVSLPGLPPLPMTLQSASGFGSAGLGAILGTFSAAGQFLSFNLPRTAIVANTLTIVPGLPLSPTLTLITPAGTYTADSGSFEIKTIEMKDYPKINGGPGELDDYVRMTARFTGTVHLDSDPGTPIAVTADFSLCEIPYLVQNF